MKQKASTSKRLSAFRMPPYSRHSIFAQLSCFVLTLVLLALPLAGVAPKRAPVLLPLATKLVPLGANLQAPLSIPVNPTVFVASARIVLGPLPSEAFKSRSDGHSRLQDIGCVRLPDSGVIEIPNGRSPPSD